MKHLKLYEGWKTSDDIKDMFSHYIDWEFIKDVKDMSLEYLDSGLYLSIFIMYDRIALYSFIYINYKNDCEHWYNNFPEKIDIDESKFSYLISLVEDYGIIRRDESKDLIDRIKEAYPDKVIKFLHR